MAVSARAQVQPTYTRNPLTTNQVTLGFGLQLSGASLSTTPGVTNGLASIAYADSLTNDVNNSQFVISSGRKLNAATGIQVTNLDANALTNRGSSTLVGAVEARSSVNAAGAVSADSLVSTNTLVGKAGANIAGTANVNSLISTSTISGQGGANITGAASVGGAIIASNNLQVTGTSTHGGNSTFTNNVEVKGSANVASGINASSLTSSNTIVGQSGANLTGAVGVGGTLTASNNAAVTGTANVASTISAGGAIIASNNLQVTGTSTHGGNSTFTNNVEVKGAANVAGAQNVGGLLTASNNAAITGTANISSTVSAGGAIIASNNLQVTGTSTHGGASTFTNNVEIKSGLNVAGGVNLNAPYNFTNFPGATATNLPTGQTIYLDAVNGVDAAALRGNEARPFLSFSNAVAAIQDNDTLIIRPGRYFVSTKGSPSYTIALSNGPVARIVGKTNVAIIGQGKPVIFYTNNIQILTLENVQNFEIANVVFQCTNKPGGATITNLISVIDINGSTANGRIHDCDFLNYPNHGICTVVASLVSRSQTNIWVERNFFENGGATNGVPSLIYDGAGVVPASHWYVRNNRFQRCFRGVEYQIEAGGLIVGGECNDNTFRGMQGENIVIIGNNSDDCITDLVIANNHFIDQEYIGTSASALANFAGGINRIHVKDNLFVDSLANLGYAINFQGGSPSAIKNCFISGNQIYRTFSYAIVLAAGGVCSSNTVSGNKINRCVRGIYYIGQGGLISGNEINTASADGIIVDDSGGVCRKNRIDSNLLRDIGETGISMEVGSTNNNVQNNIFDNVTIQNIEDKNTLGFNQIGPNLAGSGGASFNGTNQNGPTVDVFSRFTQWAPGSVTNDVTTSITSLLGPNDGSQVLETGFFTRNKTIVFTMRGQYWNTNAAASSARLFAYLDAGATSNVITQSFFPIPGGLNGGQFNLDITAVCMTNGTGGAIMADGLMNGTNVFTNTVTVMDMTKQYTFRFGVTNSLRTNGWRSGTASLRVQ